MTRSAKKVPERDRPIYLVIEKLVLNVAEINVARNITKGDQIKVSRSQVGSIGRASRASNIRQVQKNAGAPLAKDLARLQATLKKNAATPEQQADVDIVAAAKQAAAQGDEGKAKSLLGKVGGWVAETVREVGPPVATELVKKALGL